MKQENPYKECEFCKDLSDCPCPDIEITGDPMSPQPPEVCLKPIDVMKETWKKYRKGRKKE